MLKKFVCSILAALILTASVPFMAAASTESDWLDKSKLDKGAVGIRYDVPKGIRTKILITSGSNKDTYDLTSSAATFFSLRFGDGTYKIAIMEHVSANKYKTVKSESVQLSLKKPNDLYLNSIQNINWNEAKLAVAKAKNLIEGKKNDEEKIKAIYEYIKLNISYDNELAAKVTAVYIPDIDNTLTTKKAICYGYSTLFAAMLRSVGIPTKLVMGTTTYVKGYHAWNEVLLDGKWITVDTTVDYAYAKSKQKIDWIKKASDYTAAQAY